MHVRIVACLVLRLVSSVDTRKKIVNIIRFARCGYGSGGLGCRYSRIRIAVTGFFLLRSLQHALGTWHEKSPFGSQYLRRCGLVSRLPDVCVCVLLAWFLVFDIA